MTNYSAEVNNEIAMEMVSKLTGKKLMTLHKACERNMILTSTYGMGFAEMDVYKEGFYLTITGTRCKFSVYAEDRDGELVILDRKPNESKLHKLYTDNNVNCFRDDGSLDFVAKKVYAEQKTVRVHLTDGVTYDLTGAEYEELKINNQIGYFADVDRIELLAQ